MPDIYTYYCRQERNYDNKLITANSGQEAAEIFASLLYNRTGMGHYRIVSKHCYTGKEELFDVLLVQKPTFQAKLLDFGGGECC